MCINMSKVCNRCGQEKSLCDFGSNGKHYFKAKCKKCLAEIAATDREQNPTYLKNYYQNNKEKIKQKSNDYYEDNKKQHIIRTRNYQLQNKDKVVKHRKIYNIKKQQIETHRIHSSISAAINRACKILNIKKSKHTLEVIGLNNWDEFRTHIENQFTEGMNWNNYGNTLTSWSIDHIIPQSSATTWDDIKKLNHYTNLQPMWHVDNMKKGNKIL